MFFILVFNLTVAHLSEQLHAEEKKTQKLERTVTVIRKYVCSIRIDTHFTLFAPFRCSQFAGRRKETITAQSLEQELLKVTVNVETQTEPQSQQKITKAETAVRKCLQIVHLSSELVESAISPSTLFTKLHWFRFLVFLILCFIYCARTLTPVLIDDFVTYTSDGPAV